MINITFFGTDIFAKIILEELIKKIIYIDPDKKTPGQGFEPWRSHAPRDLKSRALPG